jgi:hypothetical protein
MTVSESLLFILALAVAACGGAVFGIWFERKRKSRLAKLLDDRDRPGCDEVNVVPMNGHRVEAEVNSEVAESEDIHLISRSITPAGKDLAGPPPQTPFVQWISRLQSTVLVPLWEQGETSLYVSLLLGVTSWILIFPCLVQWSGRGPRDVAFEAGFALAALGFIAGIISRFRCRNQKFTRVAIWINVAPPAMFFMVIGVLLLEFILIKNGNTERY